jgi:WD40 repeat protein
MAFSPDGKRLATYHQESMAALWEMPSGKLVTNIPASDAINSDLRTPAFSPDGATLALGEMGGHIRLIKWRTGEESKPIPSPSEDCYGVAALAFSPDGRLLAAGYGYSDAIIRLWDAVTGAPLGELKGHKGWVCALIFSSDGGTLFSASEDQTIRAWDVATRQERRSFQGHTEAVTGLALSPDGKTLVSCAADGTIRTWDPQAPSRHRGSIMLPGRTGPFGAAFTADSRRVVTAGRNHLVSVWQAATGKLIETIPALGTNNFAVALSPKDRLLVIGGYEGDITVWDLGGQRVVKRLQAQPRFPIYWLRFLDNGESLISLAMLIHQEVALQRWEVATWTEKPFKPIDVEWAYSLAQSPDNRFWLVGSQRGGVSVWNCATATLEHSLSTKVGSTFSVAFAPDGRHLAAVVQGAAQVWEAGTYREVAVLQPYANLVVGVVFSPDSRRLVTGMFRGGAAKDKLAFWDYVSQRDLLSLRGQGSGVMRPEFSPDGNTLMATSWEGIVELWHAPSWEEIEAAEKGAVTP